MTFLCADCCLTYMSYYPDFSVSSLYAHDLNLVRIEIGIYKCESDPGSVKYKK